MMMSLRRLKEKGRSGDITTRPKSESLRNVPLDLPSDRTSQAQSSENLLQQELERAKLQAQQAFASLEAYTRENAHLTMVIRELFIEARCRDAEIKKMKGELSGPRPGSDVVSLFTEKEAIREKLEEALEELDEERELRNVAESERVVAESNIMELSEKLQEQLEMGEVLRAGQFMGNKRRTKKKAHAGGCLSPAPQVQEGRDETTTVLLMDANAEEEGGAAVNLTREWVTVARMEMEMEKLQATCTEQGTVMSELRAKLKEAQAKALKLEQEKTALALKHRSSRASLVEEMEVLEEQLTFRVEELLTERRKSERDGESRQFSEEKWLLQEEVEGLQKAMQKMTEDFDEERQAMQAETRMLREKFEGAYKMLEEVSVVFVEEKRTLLDETKILQARLTSLSGELDQAENETEELSRETEDSPTSASALQESCLEDGARAEDDSDKLASLKVELEDLRQTLAVRDGEAKRLEDQLAEMSTAYESQQAELAHLRLNVEEMKVQRRTLLEEAYRNLGLGGGAAAAGDATPDCMPHSSRGDVTPRSGRGDGTPRSVRGSGTPRFNPDSGGGIEQFNEDALIDEIGVLVDDLNEAITLRMEAMTEVDRLKFQLEEMQEHGQVMHQSETTNKTQEEQAKGAALEDKDKRDKEVGRLQAGIEEWRVRAESLSTELASIWSQLAPLRDSNAQLEAKLAEAGKRIRELEGVVVVWEEREVSWIVENSKLDLGLQKAKEEAASARRCADDERQSGEVLAELLREANNKKGEVIMKLQEAERVEKHITEKLSLMEEEWESMAARADAAESKLLEKRKLVRMLRDELRNRGVEMGGEELFATPVRSTDGDCQQEEVSASGEEDVESPYTGGMVSAGQVNEGAWGSVRGGSGAEGAWGMMAGQDRTNSEAPSGVKKVGHRWYASDEERGLADCIAAVVASRGSSSSQVANGTSLHKRDDEDGRGAESYLPPLSSPKSPLIADLSMTDMSTTSNVPASPASAASSTSPHATLESAQVASCTTPYWTPPSKPLPYRPRIDSPDKPKKQPRQKAKTLSPLLSLLPSKREPVEVKICPRLSRERPLPKTLSLSPSGLGARAHQAKQMQRSNSEPEKLKPWLL